MVTAVQRLARRKAKELNIKPVDTYAEFQKTYYNNWSSFVLDCINWPDGKRPTQYQLEILDSIPIDKRKAVRGLHGLGKTAIAAWSVLAFALTRDGTDWKVITTASAWRQLTKYLWPEIHKWARLLDWSKIGRESFSRDELLTLSLKLKTGEAFAVASDNPALVEGAHADNIYYLFDESKAISDETFDAAEGAFSGGTGTVAYALSISTPGEPVGRFYEIHKRKEGYEDWSVRHVTTQEAIDSGRVGQKWVDQRAAQWGEKSAIYQNRVSGEFAANDESGVIPLSWVMAAIERHHNNNEWLVMNRLGVDVGISHDPSVAAEVYDDYKVKQLRVWTKPDPDTATMEIAGKVKGILDANTECQAVIDVIGIGAGVTHRLKELKANVLAFNAGEGTRQKDRLGELGFNNKRSAAWWMMRELLDPELGEDVMLTDDEDLVGELTTPKYRVISGGKIQIESKEDVKKRLKGRRSTDKADAVIQGLVGWQLCSFEIEVLNLAQYLKQRQ